MITQGTGAILNIIFDPILIFGYFGFPKMGAAGAALATVFGQIVAMLRHESHTTDLTESSKQRRGLRISALTGTVEAERKGVASCTAS